MSGEANSFAYLTQRLSVAVQRSNAALVLGTMKVDSEDEEFFCISFIVLFYYSGYCQEGLCHVSMLRS